MVLLERRAIALGAEVVAQGGHPFAKGAGVGRGMAVEAPDVAQHRPEPPRHQVARLGEQAHRRIGPVLERPIVERHREAHLGAPGRDPEMPEEGGEVGIVDLVVDDEAHVDRRGASLDRVAVAAQATFGLIDRHPMRLAEQPGRRHARNARADHRDLERLTHTLIHP